MGVAGAGPLCVVGYSRSGTKFVCNLIESASHGRAVSLGELHFWGRLAETGLEEVSDTEVDRIEREMANQYLKKNDCPFQSVPEVLDIVRQYRRERSAARSVDVYLDFMRAIVTALGASRGIDGTPRNAYYVAEILSLVPDAHIVFMLRDPRDCVLSQKRKPRRVWNGGRRAEAIRLAVNYNPFIMGRFWAASVARQEAHQENARVLTVQYEDLVWRPGDTLSTIAAFTGVSAIAEMGEKVRVGNTSKWSAGLTHGELAAVELAAFQTMKRHGYAPVNGWLSRTFFATMWLARFILTFPAVYLLNRKRFRRLSHEVAKRTGGQ